MKKELQIKIEQNIAKNEDELFSQISKLIDDARSHVQTAVNTVMVYTYFGVGSYIVNFEQKGNTRAKYGKQTIKKLSEKLNVKYGKGWSIETLKKARKFYEIYSQAKKVYTVDPIKLNFNLSWNHYQILMRIENQEERQFYEIECVAQNWGVRQLQRQYNSSLYERLALSKDKKEVMRLANEGHVVEKSKDILKDPLTLEFLGLSEEAVYSENHLETAIINKLQKFLLELGKGFLFEARQKRFTFDEDNYFVDLVFYNRLLQCYVLIDLKIDKLTHQDLGQMQMYVNYFDRHVKQDFEKPTIGILLCKEKNDALVELTLPEDANIYAQKYELYLPDKKMLQEKLKEWIEESEGESDA
jgi:predicted nuclease of restriction endonuclease-like (RecB) superfamily